MVTSYGIFHFYYIYYSFELFYIPWGPLGGPLGRSGRVLWGPLGAQRFGSRIGAHASLYNPCFR